MKLSSLWNAMFPWCPIGILIAIELALFPFRALIWLLIPGAAKFKGHPLHFIYEFVKLG